MRRPVVIGGGFAGLAAACRIAAAGLKPILLERSPRLGGRAASFIDRSSGEEIDDGVHVLMRCCEAALGFLQRVGASDRIRLQPRLRVPVLSAEKGAILASAPLPGILHLAPSLFRYELLPLRDRLSVPRAALGLLASKPAGEPFGEWLRRRGQSDAAIERLWNPISVATLNAQAAAVDVASARKVFRTAFFRPGGADIGLFHAPLGEVFRKARAYVEAYGGEVWSSTGARRIAFDANGAICGVETTAAWVDAGAVVIAVPPREAVPLFAAGQAPPALQRAADQLAWSPIVNVHAWFDRPVLDEAFAIVVGSPVQAVFDIARLYGRAKSGPWHLALSQSAAGEWIGRPAKEIADALLSALRDVFPAVRAARCLRTVVLSRPQATFIPSVGHEAARPGATTPSPGVYLAGDWTATGWPSTIESAVRSGIRAAARVEQRLAAHGQRDGGEAET